jgi:hypothetical protein
MQADFLKEKLGLVSSTKWMDWSKSDWKSLDDLKKVYDVGSNLPQPKHVRINC